MPAGEPVLATAEPPPWLKGRYQVTRLLGKGAQARVYVAYDTRLKLWRALKVLAPAFVEDADVRARFEQEAHAMARLAHPNLVRVVDVDSSNDVPFLVMELAHGGAITDWIKRNGPVPPVLACRIVAQMCDGLAHCHEQGVVHRDVKPHNVLIRADGNIVLTDFGIAQVALDGVQLTATGTVMGTFAFMAPEQRTDAKSVDLRADIYSVGATLFTILTAKTSSELFFAEAKDGILREVPELLRPVVLTACRYDRDERYGSALELKDALERRMARLPRDRDVPPLHERLLQLPSEPQDVVDADAGLDELRTQLGMASLSTPRHPSLRGPTPAPVHITPIRDRATRDPLARVTSESAASLRRAPMPYRITQTHSHSGSWRDYTDNGPPAPPKPIKIDLDGARSLSAEYAPEPVPFLFGPSRFAVLFVLLVATVLSLMATGMADKFVARWRYEQASIDLMVSVQRDRPVITYLEDVGADTSLLITQMEALGKPMRPDAKAQAAAKFAESVLREAQVRDLPDLPRSHVANLGNALHRWQDAAAHRERVRQGWLARLTGDLGL